MPMQGRIRRTNLTERRNFLLLGLVAVSGCSSFFKSDDVANSTTDPFLFDEDEPVEYVGQLTDTWGLGLYRVEGIAMMTELDGTGSDPPTGPRRTRLLNDMKVRQVEDGRDILRSDDTALVLVQGFLAPGIKKGERFDIFVQTPSRTKTTSLRGGYLMPTRLQPHAVLGSGIRVGSVQGNARGAILVDSIFEPNEDYGELNGVVLGGGVATVSRPFGLVCQSDIASIAATTMISAAINRRFDTIEHGERLGVATPKNDEIIELRLPTEYRFHLGRYIQVLRNIVVDEDPEYRAERIQKLGRELHDPFLASRAAMRLEAVGDDAISLLLDGLNSRNPEIRFYAAESLAYMGQDEAAAVLGDVAKHHEAFRWHAMTALASMNSVEASVALSDLLHHESPETRYAAFRALHSRSPHDPSVRGELLDEDFFYHVIDSNASPFVHFSRAKRPEISLFGRDQRLADNFIYVKRGNTVRANGDGTVTISQFDTQGRDKIVDCSTRIDEVFREMVRMGAGFEELLDLARHAEQSGTMRSRLEIHAVPDPTRGFESEEDGEGAIGTGGGSFGTLPDLYANSANQVRNDDDEFLDEVESSPSSPRKKKSFFGRMTSWWKSE